MGRAAIPLRGIILASRSKARRKLLKEAGLSVRVAYADIDESRLKNEPVSKYAIRVAYAKAKKIAGRGGRRGCPVIIGVDTVISIGKKILGKPKNRAEAFRYLKLLSGRTHKVYSGMAVIDTKNGQIFKDVTISKVKFSKLSSKMIDWYISTGEPLKAAGAYSIQEKGKALVESIDGCLTSIIGISLPKLFRILGIGTLTS
ncbi:MAG: septum formation protein Maf [Deltaproteobacteria bacterium]|nr:septum formation protein Maf [Deltaproteobacteria bacterium]MBI2342621.1 septum formation protein Maf [Deltaproteobacteria bacterium]